MIEELRSIILSEGVAVELEELGNPPVQTTALIGRSTQQFSTNLYSLEYHRMAKFLPEVYVDNGMILRNLVNGDSYLIASAYKEVIQEQIASTICHVLKTNVSVDVVRIAPRGDKTGNITNVELELYTNVPVYVRQVSAELHQYRPGLFEKVEILVYAPPMQVKLLDQVRFHSEGSPRYKIEYLDYVEFPGLTVMGVCSETRG